MSDPKQHCPSGFKQVTSYSPPLRLCGRATSAAGCTSQYFHPQEPYTQVAGRIIGYQFGAPYAFYLKGRGIDSYYVDGFSVTHGQHPRKHIWTFAAGSNDKYVRNSWSCPCSYSSTSTSPSFVGHDFFCETANHYKSYTGGTPFYSHPLWDGQRCGGKTDCCHFNKPPWFCKQLPVQTTEPIEIRDCVGAAPTSSDVQFELLEIFVR